MTERLYYTDPTLLEFDGNCLEFIPDEKGGRIGLILDRTAFYPTSGGQLHDTGWLGGITPHSLRLPVVDVQEREDGSIIHFVDLSVLRSFEPGTGLAIAKNAPIHFTVDAPRRRDHMQQHTGQHLLSAVFIELLNAPTVSFHMGDESCTIDLAVKSLTAEQIREAERRSNEIVLDDVPVEIKFVTPDEARQMGVRKIPPELTGTLRLIEIRGHDLTACGGTHVSRTGQIGPILLRKAENVKQGVRVEFVCGLRAVAMARRDFDTLTSAAALFSTHIYDLPAQIRNALDEAKAAGKRRHRLEEEVAEFMAARLLAETAERGGLRVVTRTVADRELPFIKLLAQKLTAHSGVVALLATTLPQPALVFAQSPGAPFDMGVLMKQAMTTLGGRGGGSRDLAQGGAPVGADLHTALERAALSLAP